jgi:pyridoxal phosphate enzyme (YggS family)
MPNSLSERLLEVRHRIDTAANRSGRAGGEVTLVAVSKTHPCEQIQEALDAGQMLFGENRVQEAKAKIPLLPSRTRWHLIGHLQKNKIRSALPLFELSHGVDTLALAEEINRIAADLGLFPRLLLEVNVAGEASKFGFEPAALRACFEDLLALDRLQIEGLMTIAPLVEKPELARPFFIGLRELRDQLQSEFRVSLPQLSMGMSGDYEIAVEEGATLVRVGTAIFGTRSAKALKLADSPDSP